MTADDLVDAALVGLEKGEAFTAPGLADIAGGVPFFASARFLRQPAGRQAGGALRCLTWLKTDLTLSATSG
ncbi:hypothetical protein [Mesorhizobium sp. M0482]|uniref:hypothetical protein n=1 Tax=unclassified Mesorhizobium TaxID=325217 RepID=UPI00333CCA85